jgi:Tfp pilus assembly protein PilF
MDRPFPRTAKKICGVYPGSAEGIGVDCAPSSPPIARQMSAPVSARRLALLAFLLAAQAPDRSAAGPPVTPEPLAVPLPAIARDLAGLGVATTAGAAPGFAETYAAKGMARAFRRPGPESGIEDFAAPPFVHAASRQQLQIVRRDGRLLFRRWQLDGAGRSINLFEREVDWILGSGNHARIYLYRTPGGELYQLPLAWYTQEAAWGMAPGFDRPDHDGVLRRVRRECLFCHDAYADVPAGSDLYGAPQEFPAALPEGLGCQRCHGPGAEHVWLAMGGLGTAGEIRASVFNPGRLPAPRRDEVCMTCHLQPSVALPGLRRFGRGDFSYRAGEPLSDYLVQVDVEEEGRPPAERFEINHHPYRLRQSRCYLASDGALGCLTCHDPHRVVPERARVAHYRAACLSCHREADCSREHGTGTMTAGSAASAAASADCAGCHMPKRRTQDVVRVVMTDHLIARRPGGPELLAPTTERDPSLVGVRLIGAGAPAGELGEVYRAATAVRAGAGGAVAVERLERMLAAARPAEPDPYLDLAQGQLLLRRPAAAEATLRQLLARRPDQLLALDWLGLARAGQGAVDEAIGLLREVLARGGERIETEYNLGRLLAARGRPAEAEPYLERVVASHPSQVLAWFYLGEVKAARGRAREAADCYRQALAVDPTHTRSYLALGRTLLDLGERAEALRYLRHGATAAAHPEQVAAALAEAEGREDAPETL